GATWAPAAGGASCLGSAVGAAVRPWGGEVGVVWAFVVRYAAAFVMTYFLKVEQPRRRGGTTTDGGTEEDQPASRSRPHRPAARILRPARPPVRPGPPRGSSALDPSTPCGPPARPFTWREHDDLPV